MRAQTADRFSEIEVTVRPLPVRNVVVGPSVSAVLVGGQVQLEVAVYDTAGYQVENPEVHWFVDRPDLASVAGDGLVLTRGKGLVRVRATSGGRHGEAVIEVRQWPTGDAWTMDMRWPTGTLHPVVGDTTWVDASGATRRADLVLVGSTLSFNRSTGGYTQGFRLLASGLGELERQESGTISYDLFTGDMLFTPAGGGAERTFRAVPSGPAEMTVAQAVGTAPRLGYRYVVR